MKNINMIARILLGLIFLVDGLNGFLHFMPSQPINGSAGVFIGGLIGSGYFFQFLQICEIVAGLALLIDILVPLFLLFLAPITINIFLFHLFLERDGFILSTFLLLLHIYVLIVYMKYYRQLFTLKASV